jgi:hypothetical protein
VNHVLWIGGPPGAGKTTVATRLMRRHGLRYYNADTRTWDHRDRALAAGNAAAQRWEALPRAERFAQPPEELLAMSLHRERGAMVVDDVRALPPSPIVVAEGSVITPRSLPDGARAVWLVAAPDVLERQLVERDSRSNALYRLLAGEIEAEARAAGADVLAIEGIPATLDAVESLFADVLARGPCARSIDERRALLRDANLAQVEQVRGFYARPWAEGDPDAVDRVFICECGDPACEADVSSAVGLVATAPALAPGHAP